MGQIAEHTEIMTPNRLIPLKLLVFLFFGALQCMYAFLPYHMQVIGFGYYDIRLVTLISGLVSMIGPLIIGFILDRLTIKKPSAYGKYLRVLLFIFFILAGISFGALLLVPHAEQPLDLPDTSVTFSCNDDGGFVYISKNLTNGHCTDLESRKGELKLINCSYTCESPENFNLYQQTDLLAKGMSEKIVESSSENPFGDYEEYSDFLPEPASLIQDAVATSAPLIPPPHICLNNTKYGHCHVYLQGSEITLKDLLGDVTIDQIESNAFNENWCKHPLKHFSCNVPDAQITWMKVQRFNDSSACVPAVECLISDPYDKESILQFIERIPDYSGEPLPHEIYYTLRIIAEIFPIVIHMLLNIAIVIATRETSNGRGNIGHQLAFYPIGVLVFATVIGLLNHLLVPTVDKYLIPIVTFSVSMFVCALIVICCSSKLPLTPSDWWWHTKCGMLAIPMSALKRYKWVIAAIATVALILGGLWHIQEAFRHLYAFDLLEYIIVYRQDWRSKTFIYVIGALLAIPIIWNGEKIVDCFGHSNIFIIALVSFALRFAGLYFDNLTSRTTLLEILEPLSFYLPWLALILFARHLIPKKFLALGQALLVLLFFGLGRAVGFFYGTSIVADDRNNRLIWNSPDINAEAEDIDFQLRYTVAATIACVSAIIYFIVYHGILLPFYRVPTIRFSANADSNVSPQRVFHDERSRKGYFRY